MDPTSVGRELEGFDPDVDWKGWKGRRLDLDVVTGRVVRNVNRKEIERV